MADDDKKEKGTLRKVFGAVNSWPVRWTIGLGMLFAVGPVLGDVGTWYNVIHGDDPTRAEAFADTMKPLTGWIPYHLGFTGEGGFGYNLMSWFIKDALKKINNRHSLYDDEEPAEENESSLTPQFVNASFDLIGLTPRNNTAALATNTIEQNNQDLDEIDDLDGDLAACAELDLC